MNANRLLQNPGDFRLLPFFVISSTAVGIAIGAALSVADFQLTPAIDTIKAIFADTFQPTVANSISLAVPIGLFPMMYPAKTNVRLGEIRQGSRSLRHLLTVMFFVVYFVGSRLGFNYRDAVAVAFNSTGRDFEIAIAIAITAFSPTVALATVVGPLIEVPVMLTLVWSAMRLERRLYGTETAKAAVAGATTA